jgi:long-chain acyl-CoA synthetase
MNDRMRLFDCIDLQLKNFPKTDMLSAKENGKWISYSTQQVHDITNKFSAGLLNLGLSGRDMTAEGSDKIAIISNNRPEWLFTDFAAQQIGIILVPIYPTTNPSEIEFIFNDADVKYVFVSSQEMFTKIKGVLPKVASIKDIYSFDKIEGCKHWSEITKAANDTSLQQVASLKAAIPLSQIATIIYTSGTTGVPKGVMLSHNNISSNVKFSKDSFPFEDAPHKKVLSFLPLNHIFEKMATYIYLFSGIGIYYAESLDTIGDNLKEIKPDGFTTVPRLLEKVFEKIMTTGSQLTGIKKALFFWAVSVAEKYDNLEDGGAWYNLQLALANKLIFKKWREALGGNISFIITGGAACQVKLLRIFNGGKIPVYEGYGPTENSPVICVNRRINGQKFGTVGPPISGIEVKLAEDGEILVAGPCVMEGYYKRPDLTAETLINGWLHTGDIGIWVDNKYLKITDRKKELFKTSGGKYVAPQPIENKFKESPFIEQIMIVGSERKFVGALIVPSFTHLKAWMLHKHLPYTSNLDALKQPEVLEKFQSIIAELNQYFNPVEQVKKFEILAQEWSVETGEMTPKLSLKRKVVMEKCAVSVNNIYKD